MNLTNGLPWVLVAFLGGIFISQQFNKVDKPANIDVSTNNSFNNLLTKEEALFLSNLSDNISKLINKDNQLLSKRQDVLNLIENCGVVLSYDRSPISGLGDILLRYFDEESEFPQLSGELTPEDRVKASNNWKKISQDLLNIQSYKVIPNE